MLFIVTNSFDTALLNVNSEFQRSTEFFVKSKQKVSPDGIVSFIVFRLIESQRGNRPIKSIIWVKLMT